MDNYTRGGALPGRPASSHKEWVIKQKRLKEKKSAYARAAGHVAPDEVLAGQVNIITRRTPRKHVPKVIKNLGELPSHRQSRSRKLVSRQSAIDTNLNIISSRISQLGLVSQGSRSRGSRSLGYRSLGSRSRASRSRASRLPAVAEQPFVLAPATFGFRKFATEDSMGSNKGGRRTRSNRRSQRQLRRSRSRSRSRRSSRKN